MSFKKYVSMFLVFATMIAALGSYTPAQAAKSLKADTDAQAVSGCVLSGFGNVLSVATGGAASGTVVTIRESGVPKASASKKSEDNKAALEKADKESKKIAAQKKAAKKKYKKALRLLAAIVYCEAGGQCYAGRLAVAAVVMNRVESKGYPNTIRGVLWQPYQFGPIRQGKMARELRYYDKGLYNQPERIGSLQAAKDILAGKYTVVYNGKKIDLKKYHNFNGHLSNAKIRISGHDFA
ncbi:MAG: cell wall hydrolase [Eubacterium sp.]|nr:cell wall hydrolase [Eubacterium sp.]